MLVNSSVLFREMTRNDKNIDSDYLNLVRKLKRGFAGEEKG